MEIHTRRPGRLAPDHDPPRIAAKIPDIIPYPLERRALIQESQILLRDPCRIREAEDIHAIVDRDHDVRLAALDLGGRDLSRNQNPVRLEPASGPEERDRQIITRCRRGRGPDGEAEAVLGGEEGGLPRRQVRRAPVLQVLRDLLGPDGGVGGDVLRAGFGVVGGVEVARRQGDRFGRLEAVLACGCLAVGDVEEFADVGVVVVDLAGVVSCRGADGEAGGCGCSEAWSKEEGEEDES